MYRLVHTHHLRGSHSRY